MELRKNVAVVGGGIGGITTAALLASRGYHVDVFDKNAIIGGYCQAFMRKGNLIHPAVLRVGSDNCVNSVNSYLKQVGAESINWLKYHETYEFGENIHIRQGSEFLRSDLESCFPEEKAGIYNFFRDIALLYEIMNKVFANNMTTKGLTVEEMKLYLPAIRKSAVQFVDEYFKHNTTLRDIMLSMLELDPKSVALAIPMTYFEIKGSDAYYVPEGGAFEIIKHLRKVIEDHGGMIHTQKVVTAIRVENRQCVGVECKDAYYPCDLVVSSVDINRTYQSLIGAEKVEDGQKMLKRLQTKWKISKSCFSVWVGFDVPLEDLDVPYGSIVYYQNEKNIARVREIMSTSGETLPEDFWMQIFSVFSHDPKTTLPGQSQVCLGLLLPYDFENQWGGEKYTEKKQEILERVLTCFKRKFPKAESHITFVEAATPKTYEAESWNTNGAYLGFEKYENFVYDRGRHQNQGLLPNLFFSSHWVSIIGGVNGVMQEALKTANLIMTKYPLLEEDHTAFDVY